MAEESTSQSVTLVSIVNSDSRSVGSDTQFQSTAEGSGSAYGSENDNSDSSSRTMQSLGLPEREQEEDDLRSGTYLLRLSLSGTGVLNSFVRNRRERELMDFHCPILLVSSAEKFNYPN
jgi:hypothetical protein